MKPATTSAGAPPRFAAQQPAEPARRRRHRTPQHGAQPPRRRAAEEAGGPAAPSSPGLPTAMNLCKVPEPRRRAPPCRLWLPAQRGAALGPGREDGVAGYTGVSARRTPPGPARGGPREPTGRLASCRPRGRRGCRRDGDDGAAAGGGRDGARHHRPGYRQRLRSGPPHRRERACPMGVIPPGLIQPRNSHSPRVLPAKIPTQRRPHCVIAHGPQPFKRLKIRPWPMI